MLGFVNAAGIGQYGLEQQYDTVLAGRPEIVKIDPEQNLLIVKGAVPGGKGALLTIRMA